MRESVVIGVWQKATLKKNEVKKSKTVKNFTKKPAGNVNMILKISAGFIISELKTTINN